MKAPSEYVVKADDGYVGQNGTRVQDKAKALRFNRATAEIVAKVLTGRPFGTASIEDLQAR